jgi:hypothetical protein
LTSGSFVAHPYGFRESRMLDTSGSLRTAVEAALLTISFEVAAAIEEGKYYSTEELYY